MKAKAYPNPNCAMRKVAGTMGREVKLNGGRERDYMREGISWGNVAAVVARMRRVQREAAWLSEM